MSDTPMVQVEFCGYSDDLCEVRGPVRGADEYCNDGDSHGKHAFSFIVRRGYETDYSEGIRVNALYDGGWSFAVGMMDEGAPLPPWGIAITGPKQVSYSMTLTLTVPADAEVVRDELGY